MNQSQAGTENGSAEAIVGQENLVSTVTDISGSINDFEGSTPVRKKASVISLMP
jgi:hypothetical protein